MAPTMGEVAITGSGEELPKESLEFNYGACEYQYRFTDHNTGKPDDNKISRFAWTTVNNKEIPADGTFTSFAPS